MSSQRDRSVALLAELVGYRTDNPDGDELALCERLAAELRARRADSVDVVTVERPGRREGGYVYACYGSPRLLINVHLDTVPANTGWTREPWRATIEDDRIYGLGTADTKGAIAAVLTVLDEITPRDVGILFSGDEERGTHCVQAFVASERLAGIERAIVCEPTARRAGVRHRGMRAYRATVGGRGGHSSAADTMPRPIVVMAGLALALDELGREYLDTGPEDMRGLCMNVAALNGGVAFNVVADSAELLWSVRPPPGFDDSALAARLEALAAEASEQSRIHGGGAVQITQDVCSHPPFACRDVASFQALLGNAVSDYGKLDFWTEAAVLATAGVDAVVVGPGDIAQAHAPDEFVTFADLEWAQNLFGHVLKQYMRP